MGAIFTYCFIDSNKATRVSTHPAKDIAEFTRFVLNNKDYIIWANLMDVANGQVVEQYINIKNYANSNIEKIKLVLKGKDIEHYKRAYIIHRLEIQDLINFIKVSRPEFYDRIVAEKSLKMTRLSSFLKSEISEQFFVVPSQHYDLVMGEFTSLLMPYELPELEELIPIAKEVFVDIEEQV